MSGRVRPARARRADLSQHFLRDERASELVRTTSISRADLVVEIGAGRGALTRPLAAAAGHLIAVELDGYLAGRLARVSGSRVDVVTGDFLRLPMPGERYKVVGNLPYSATAAIVRKLTETPRPPLEAWLIMQREAAWRLCGSPYVNETRWSLGLKVHWHLEILSHLKRTDFRPPPAVDSVWLWMCRRLPAILDDRDARLFDGLLAHCYGRPTVAAGARRWLSKLQLRRLAGDLRFLPEASPSSLTFEQWLGIFRFVAGARRLRGGEPG